MAFSQEEYALLLTIKGVGEAVVSRIEQVGFSSFEQLAKVDAEDILFQVSAMLGSSCWKNSPKARSAINAMIAMVKESA